MKGIVLAGGLGTRLRPLTNVINKHLLGVYDRPMIFYPLEMLAEAGIEDVMMVVGGQSTEAIMKLCKDGRQWGFKSLYYVYQADEGGIAHALSLTEHFLGEVESCCVVLGDNIMLGDSLTPYIDDFVNAEEQGAMVLAAEVPDPQNYGVPTFDDDVLKRISFITEKPEHPACNLGIIGVYLYDRTVFSRIRTLTPSKRGELEITDVNNSYASDRELSYRKVKGTWIDTGTSIEAWIAAGKLVEEYQKRHEEFPELLKKG